MTVRTRRYQSKTYNRFLVLVRKDNEAIDRKLTEVPSRNAYIVGLIEQDIAKGKK